MKKKIFAVILSAILALAIPSAIVGAYYNLPLDVGNFHRYSGGSHRSSGGTHRSSGSGSSGSSIDWSDPADLAFFIIFLVVFSIIFMLVIIAAKKSSKKSSKKSPKNFSAYVMPTDCTAQITEFIKQTDMDFNSDKFIAWSKNIFITLQTAWTERDWEKIRTLEKEELFEQHNTQIQEYIRLGRINVMERINVNQAYLHKYVRDENYENLTVCMKVRMIDYIIDEKSGKLLMGSKTADIDTTYLLTFIRSKGVTTTLIDGVISNSCPHCGAPVDSASAGRCEYCGSIIHLGEYNWVLSDMQAVDENFQNDSRGIIILDNDNDNI